jgi:hypothetical protein
MHTAKPCGNIGGAVPCLTRPKAVLGLVSRRALIAALAASDPPITLKQASRAIGRNNAYLQQFLHRGTPRRLPEDVRHRLAAFLDMDQSRQFAVLFFDLSASAGDGAQIDLASETAQDPDNQ